MNYSITEPARGGLSRTSRWGMGLALVALLYIAAVIAFIIAY
jgi:hypothetical protein